MADHKFARRLVSYAATGIARENNVLHTAHTGTLLRAARGCVRRYQVRRPLLPSFLFMHFISLSLSCFADLSRCGPFRIGGQPWSTGCPGMHLYLPFYIVAAVPSHLAFIR
jgi:hypothetical protein